MSTDRIQRHSAISVVVTVGLLLVPAVRVGSTAAAPGASSSSALHGAVSIHLWGPAPGTGQSGSRALHHLGCDLGSREVR